MTTDDKELLAEVVAAHWQAYRKRLRECRRQLSEESVHKLRISLRRLLALLGLLQYLCPQRRIGKLRKTLKTQLSALSELRDIQVMRLEISLWVGELPQLQSFLHQLHLRELEILTVLPDTLTSWRSGKLQRKFNKISRVCTSTYSNAQPLKQLIAGLAKPLAQRTQQRLAGLDNDKPASYHKLRIAIKKLRYSLELAKPWLAEPASEQAAMLKSFQDLLGELQNGEVLRWHLSQAFAAAEPPSSLQTRLSEQHRQLLACFDSRQQTLSELLNACSLEDANDKPTPQSNEQA